MSNTDLTADERLDRIERTIEWIQADVALAVRGMQALLQLHGINGQLKQAFARWEATMDERADSFGRDETTQPGDRPVRTEPAPPMEGAE